MSDARPLGSSVTRVSDSPVDRPAGHPRFGSGDIIAARYRIVALLGRGGMGEVYRADDLTLGHSVALKFLPAGLARDSEWLERLRGEVRAARLVSHANVCRVHDIGDVEGQPFLSMEYIDGEDLASLLRRIGRLPQDKALDVARQLCAGLAAAHERGVIHRDLKPANVMLDGRGNVRITDFGLAGVPEPARGGVAGTPAYMAPELFGNAAASVGSDIYALGLVLYEIFSGRPAVQAATIADIKRLHSEVTPTKLTSIVTDLDPLIDRIVFQCLAIDPAARPVSALAVSAALPGGDPLAAALARGETPSPEAVAAAGQVVGIQPAIAMASLAATIAGLAVVAGLSGRTQLARVVALEKPPVILSEQARGMIARFGYTHPAPHSAFGFHPSEYLSWLWENDFTPTRWDNLQRGQPPGLTFWYRQDSMPLTSDGFFFAGRVMATDPPLAPGSIVVVSDPRGQLRFLSASPPRLDAQSGGQSADWSRLLAEAGFDATRFTAVESTRIPPVYADVRRAWEGVYPERADIKIRVEAAAVGGRPVYFEIFEPWTRDSLVERMRLVERGSVPILLGMLVFVAGAILLAYRHYRMGRGDPLGALRLAEFLVVLHVTGSLLGASVVSVVAFLAIVARGLLLGAAVWVAYMALEPFLRRHWPSTMISWNRLLAGRVRDPLVGRDLLIGLLAGVLCQLLWQAGLIAPRWFGMPPGLAFDPTYEQLNGLRFTAAAILRTIGTGVLLATSFVLLFFLLSLILRRRWLAGITVALLLAAGSWFDQGAVLATSTLLMYLVIAVVLLRFGLLALIVASIVTPILDHSPLTLDPSSWYAPNSFLVLLFVAALAAYAFRLALAGRPMLSGAFFGE